jgi:hypothetical protein
MKQKELKGGADGGRKSGTLKKLKKRTAKKIH